MPTSRGQSCRMGQPTIKPAQTLPPGPVTVRLRAAPGFRYLGISDLRFQIESILFPLKSQISNLKSLDAPSGNRLSAVCPVDFLSVRQFCSRGLQNRLPPSPSGAGANTERFSTIIPACLFPAFFYPRFPSFPAWQLGTLLVRLRRLK